MKIVPFWISPKIFFSFQLETSQAIIIPRLGVNDCFCLLVNIFYVQKRVQERTDISKEVSCCRTCFSTWLRGQGLKCGQSGVRLPGVWESRPCSGVAVWSGTDYLTFLTVQFPHLQSRVNNTWQWYCEDLNWVNIDELLRTGFCSH